MSQLNALTIDLEDWRQLVYWKMTGKTILPQSEVVPETEFILKTLAEHNVFATFFVLANIAETFPNLIRRIDEAGHEIASHGLSHTLVYHQTPAEFRQETREAKKLLESIIGKPIYGYRAAEFSITKLSWWALDILSEEGFVYDSSIYPIAGKRYGVPNAPFHPHVIRTSQNNSILEFPLTAIEKWGRRWPVAGGGYFRLLPYQVTQAAIKAVNRQKRPAIAYFHPYEFAPHQLRIPMLKPSLKGSAMFVRYAMFHNLARQKVRKRFLTLLRDFYFTTMGDLIQNVELNSKIL